MTCHLPLATCHLIDTHAHLNFPQYQDDTIDNVLARAHAAGVSTIINVGASLEASQEAVALAEKYPEIYATIGIHPHDAGTFTDDTLATLRALSARPKVVAIGEIGLDYFKYDGDRTLQRDVFRAQLALAKEKNLPVVIHDREAHEDVLTMLKEFLPVRGVMHCFSGDIPFAQKLLDIGFLISFTGNITFPKASNLRSVVEYIPLEKLMVETDCPFLAPQAHRGQRNEPAYVVEVVRTIAEIKKISLEEVARTTTGTARTFFSLD